MLNQNTTNSKDEVKARSWQMKCKMLMQVTTIRNVLYQVINETIAQIERGHSTTELQCRLKEDTIQTQNQTQNTNRKHEVDK